MDDKIMTEINEMLKADGERELSLDELKDVAGGMTLDEWSVYMVKVADERRAFKNEICQRTGMRTVEKAILTNQLSADEQRRWVEINEAYRKGLDDLVAMSKKD